MPKFTKTPPAIVAAFDAATPARAGVIRKTMFSYPALFVNGNMFAFTFGPRIAVRLGPADRAKVKPFAPMPGRPMTEYVEVPEGDMNGARLRAWVGKGLAYAESLPARSPKARSPKALSEGREEVA